jgi:cytochrome c553
MNGIGNIEHRTLNAERRSEGRASASSMFRVRCSEFDVPAFLTFVLLLAFVSFGCRRDMFSQPSEKPLERNSFFQDNNMASRPLPAHTVARGQLNGDEAFYTGKIGANLVTDFPMPVTREVLLRGQERFNIYCAPCHGRTGEGNGMIPQRGYPAPPSYHIDRLRTAPVGHFYDVITRGYGVMYSYASRVEPEDRWAIVAYIRALQLSHNAKISDVPEQQRAQLEGTK